MSVVRKNSQGGVVRQSWVREPSALSRSRSKLNAEQSFPQVDQEDPRRVRAADQLTYKTYQVTGRQVPAEKRNTTGGPLGTERSSHVGHVLIKTG